MPNNIDVNIVGHDNLSAEVDRASRKVEQRAARLRNQVGNQFKNLAANMVSSVSGGAGQIVHSLGSIRHPAAIAVAAIAGVGIAFAGLAKRSAELTQMVNKSDQQSREFLNGIKNLQVGFENLVVSVGQKVIPVFLKLFDLLGIETKQAGKTREEIAKLREEQRKHAEEIAQKYAELNEQSLIAFSEGNREKLLDIVLEITELKKESGKASEKMNLLKDGTIKMGIATTFAESALSSFNETISKIRTRKDTFSNLFEGLQKNAEILNKIKELQIDANDQLAKQDSEDFIGLANQKLEQQKDLYRQIGQNVQNMVSSLAQSIVTAQDLGDIIKSTIASFLQLAVAHFLPIPFGANGLIAMQGGSIVRRPTAALIGEAGPEAVVPLSPGKARERNAVMQAAGLGNNAVTLNINMPNVRNVDQLSIRNDLLPAINKQIRRGERLLASKLR